MSSPGELFVAVLGVSHFVYAEATLTQRLEAVCSSVVRCFQALGGVLRSLVPDNMKTVVGSPNPKDVPKINETFQQLADHYGVYVLPTRPGHPKDKAAASRKGFNSFSTTYWRDFATAAFSALVI